MTTYNHNFSFCKMICISDLVYGEGYWLALRLAKQAEDLVKAVTEIIVRRI